MYLSVQHGVMRKYDDDKVWFAITISQQKKSLFRTRPSPISALHSLKKRCSVFLKMIAVFEINIEVFGNKHPIEKNNLLECLFLLECIVPSLCRQE